MKIHVRKIKSWYYLHINNVFEPEKVLNENIKPSFENVYST